MALRGSVVSAVDEGEEGGVRLAQYAAESSPMAYVAAPRTILVTPGQLLRLFQIDEDWEDPAVASAYVLVCIPDRWGVPQTVAYVTHDVLGPEGDSVVVARKLARVDLSGHVTCFALTGAHIQDQSLAGSGIPEASLILLRSLQPRYFPARQQWGVGVSEDPKAVLALLRLLSKRQLQWDDVHVLAPQAKQRKRARVHKMRQASAFRSKYLKVEKVPHRFFRGGGSDYYVQPKERTPQCVSALRLFVQAASAWDVGKQPLDGSSPQGSRARQHEDALLSAGVHIGGEDAYGRQAVHTVNGCMYKVLKRGPGETPVSGSDLFMSGGWDTQVRRILFQESQQALSTTSIMPTKARAFGLATTAYAGYRVFTIVRNLVTDWHGGSAEAMSTSTLGQLLSGVLAGTHSILPSGLYPVLTSWFLPQDSSGRVANVTFKHLQLVVLVSSLIMLFTYIVNTQVMKCAKRHNALAPALARTGALKPAELQEERDKHGSMRTLTAGFEEAPALVTLNLAIPGSTRTVKLRRRAQWLWDAIKAASMVQAWSPSGLFAGGRRSGRRPRSTHRNRLSVTTSPTKY